MKQHVFTVLRFLLIMATCCVVITLVMILCITRQFHHIITIIIMAITAAANCTVPKIPCSSLRPFWTEELDELKSDSVFWHHMWLDAGSPSSGCMVMSYKELM